MKRGKFLNHKPFDNKGENNRLINYFCNPIGGFSKEIAFLNSWTQNELK